MTPPDDFRVPAYGVCEHGGLIWASTGVPPNSVDAGLNGGNLRFCRDLVVRQNPERVAARVQRAIFKPFGGGAGDAVFEHTEIAPSVIRINARFDGGSASVVLAIHPISRDRAGLHVLAAGETPAERRHYAEWARRLRWFMENPEAATSSWNPLPDRKSG